MYESKEPVGVEGKVKGQLGLAVCVCGVCWYVCVSRLGPSLLLAGGRGRCPALSLLVGGGGGGVLVLVVALSVS